jgi:hypothetical protein
MDKITRRIEKLEAAISKECEFQHFTLWNGEGEPLAKCPKCGARVFTFRLTTDEPAEAPGE